MKYYMKIQKDSNLLYEKFFEADVEGAAIEEMEKEIKRIYAESKDTSKHNTNLYELVWINGV